MENYWHYLSKWKNLRKLSKALESLDIFISQHIVLLTSKYWRFTANILPDHFLYTECTMCLKFVDKWIGKLGGFLKWEGSEYQTIIYILLVRIYPVINIYIYITWKFRNIHHMLNKCLSCLQSSKTFPLRAVNLFDSTWLLLLSINVCKLR